MSEDRAARDVGLDDDGQHRDAGGRVIPLAGEREGPEMRRRPQEKHQREDQRRGIERCADRCGARQYRETAGQPADDNVPPRPTLEPDRVDDSIRECAEEDIQRGETVARPGRGGDRRGQHRPDAPHPAGIGLEPPGHERTLSRALHARIGIALVQLVERACRRGRGEHRQTQYQHLPRRQRARRADRNAGQRAGHDQEPEPNLGRGVNQLEILRDQYNGHTSDRYFQLTK